MIYGHLKHPLRLPSIPAAPEASQHTNSPRGFPAVQPASQEPPPAQPATQDPAPVQPATQGPAPVQPARDKPALHPKHPGVASCTA